MTDARVMPQDKALGEFLEENCFDLSAKCESCKRGVLDHLMSFVHNDGRVDITVGWSPFNLASAAQAATGKSQRCVGLGWVR